jgi:hypothetical protein
MSILDLLKKANRIVQERAEKYETAIEDGMTTCTYSAGDNINKMKFLYIAVLDSNMNELGRFSNDIAADDFMASIRLWRLLGHEFMDAIVAYTEEEYGPCWLAGTYSNTIKKAELLTGDES